MSCTLPSTLLGALECIDVDLTCVNNQPYVPFTWYSQAHPDKKLAERLYATRPDLYKDDNHKPEMAVALSDFEGLCGFRPFEEIVFNLHRYPELRGLVSLSAMRAMCSLPEDPEDRRDALRKLFQSYITAKPEVVATQVNALVQRLGERAADDGGFSSDGSSLVSVQQYHKCPRPRLRART